MEENKKGIVNWFALFFSFIINVLICLIFGLIGAGCVTGIVFLCKLCYSIIYGGPLW